MQTSTPQNFGQPFPTLEGVRGGLSLRLDGCMSFKRDKREKVVANRRDYLTRHGLSIDRGVAPDLVHGKQVMPVCAQDAGNGMLDPETKIPETDALVTNDPLIFLVTTHADCAPIYYYDPVHQAIGLAHAGWRGILAGIASEVVCTMQHEFGSLASELLVAVGPTISQEIYEVSSDVASQFEAKFGNRIVRRIEGKVYLDLPGAIACDLSGCGLPAKHVQVNPPCTYGNPQFSSYRRDGEACAPMLAWLRVL